MTIQTYLDSDRELVERSLRGDRAAFGHIVERYQSLICAVTYSATGDISRSEDLAQETFLAAWRGLGGLKEPERLKPWLCGIARHLVQEFHRRSVRDPLRRAGSLDAAALENASRSFVDGDPRIGKEAQALLWRVLEGLPESYREPLVLFYRQDQSVWEVAGALGVSEDVVRQRLSRGRAMLSARVSGFIESALHHSGPADDFAPCVIAALPALAATAHSAAAGTAAAASKASGGAKMAGLLGTIVSPVGAIGACAGAIAAIWGRIAAARTGRERGFLLKTLPAGIVIWLAIFFVTVRHAFGDLVLIIDLRHAIGVLVLWLGLWGPLTAYMIWISRHQRRIQIEDGTLQSAPSGVGAGAPQAGLRKRVYGGLAALIFGAMVWLMVLARSGGDSLMLCLLPVAAVGGWLASARFVLRRPENVWTRFSIVYWAFTILICGVVNWRLRACWHGPLSADLEHTVRLIMNVLVIGFYSSIGLTIWLVRHFVASNKPRRDAAVASAAFIALFLLGLVFWRS